MIGRQDLVSKPCPNCKGKGKDPRKRTRPCPGCDGSGKAAYCANCGGLYGVECVGTLMDQTCCGRPEPIPIGNLSNIHMTLRGENVHPVVIHNGMVKRWVGMGWVTEEPATAEDRAKYPEAK